MAALPKPLSEDVLHRKCDPAEIPFETTADATEVQEIVGQDRAVDAVRFGIGIRRDGYNLFAVGPPGLGKQTLLRQFLHREAANQKTPPDWCYGANFADVDRPRAIRLPPGMGRRLRAEMERAVSEIRTGMRAAFDSEEYRSRKRQLSQTFKERRELAFGEAQARAQLRGVAIIQTDDGIVIVPYRGGAPLAPDEFQKQPKNEQAELKAEMERFGGELETLFRQFHEWGREHRRAADTLARETSAGVARRILDELRAGYPDLPQVLSYLNDVEKDVVANAGQFLQPAPENLETVLRRALHPEPSDDAPSFRRYQVNLLIDNSGQQGAPVVYVDNPTYGNLLGRVEHVSHFGTLVTDFTMIKAGALYRAAGGYLLVDALRLLQQPFAWEGLKRAMRAKEMTIESFGQLSSLAPTVTLEPERIPLEGTKIVLFGERRLYYLLSVLDPDFPELFKVMVDFEETLDRGADNQARYAQLIARLVRKEGLRPLDRKATAAVIEHASRLAEDAEKLTVHMRPILDLLREADFVASSLGRSIVGGEDVQASIEAQIRRASRVRDKFLEAVRRETILVDTSGERVAEVNGLAVVGLGEYSFGHPTRITANVRMGRGQVVDIEREVDMGGPIHAKGVLILSGFLGGRYATRAPLSLSASLVFEQSYGFVEGDSASLAELCALLSALSEVPIRQSLAVTGSVNQHGRVQPIGGVNEKIEGFFDLCRSRGLTGDQGVLIPEGNVKNLMLRDDVVAAARVGRFRIHAVATVDEAFELLTGREAGERSAEGSFPEATLNHLIEAKLYKFAERARAFRSSRTPNDGAGR